MSKLKVGRLVMASTVIALLSGGCSCSDDRGPGGAGGTAAMDGGAANGGTGGIAGTGGFGGTGGGSANGGAGGNCADANLTATNAIPTIWLLIDGSSSMQQRYGSSTRWRALRDALVGPQGVLRRLDDRINFGMAIYAGRYVNGDPAPNQCPVPGIPIAPTTSTAVFGDCEDGGATNCAIVGTRAGRNFDMLEAALPVNSSPGQFTPSGEALNWLYDQLEEDILEPDGDRAPVYVIFATDGEPNTCTSGSSTPAFGLSEEAVARGRELDVTTYVVSLAQGADSNGAFEAHLQRLANLGAGLAEGASPGAELYSPQNPEELALNLEQLISATLGCDVPLNGTVVAGMACRGTVLLNQVPLACGDPNGWSVDATGRVLRLAGNACQTFMNSAAVQINASFPCDVIVPD